MLSKLALIGVVAIQTQASQLFSAEDQMSEMLSLYEDVQQEELQSMLKVSITRRNFEKLSDQSRAIQQDMRKYRVTPEIQQRGQVAFKDLMESNHMFRLQEYLKENQAQFHKDIEPLMRQHGSVMRAKMQYERTCKPQIFGKTPNPDDVFAEVECDNGAFENYDQQVGKLVQARKEFINSKFGRGFVHKIQDMSRCDEWKALEDVWGDQCSTDIHKSIVEKVDNIIDNIFKLYKVSDDPDSFFNGNIMTEFKAMWDLVMDVNEGEFQPIIDWIDEQYDWDQ